jgi:hypothetical protein
MIGITFAWLAWSGRSATAADPAYSDYAVQSVFHGRPATPKFRPGADTWPDADPRFRESVEYQLAKGANFAGAYAIVKISCGTGCSYAVVVDVRNGHIFEDLPFRAVMVGGRDPYRGLSFHVDSRLLMVEGFVDEWQTPVRAYYEWVETNFRLIRKVPIGAR